MGFARHAAQKSKDSTKVGAALVDEDRVVRICSFNGPPRGVRDLPERFDRANGEKYFWASHAEQNLIAFAAREGIRTKSCTVYVTHHPCSSCARTLTQAGVTRVVIGAGTTSMPDREFEVAETIFREAGIDVFKIQSDDNESS